MSRSCVCGGSNENCRYCNGLGTIKEDLASALVDHAQRTDLRKDTDAYRVSADVGRLISASRRRELFLRCQEQLVPCPISGCPVRLKPNRVERHLKKAHNKAQPIALESSLILRAAESRPEGQPQAVQQLVPCPVSGCSAKLSPNHIEQHIRRAHPKRLFKRAATVPLRTGSIETRNSSVARYIVTNSIPDGTPRVSSYAQAPEKNLDATKGYAHAYRDNGRFGSHPSHDGFDGESGP
jgi:hypothetical protein